jgi:hypothetical protein
MSKDRAYGFVAVIHAMDRQSAQTGQRIELTCDSRHGALAGACASFGPVFNLNVQSLQRVGATKSGIVLIIHFYKGCHT